MFTESALLSSDVKLTSKPFGKHMWVNICWWGQAYSGSLGFNECIDIGFQCLSGGGIKNFGNNSTIWLLIPAMLLLLYAHWYNITCYTFYILSNLSLWNMNFKNLGFLISGKIVTLGGLGTPLIHKTQVVRGWQSSESLSSNLWQRFWRLYTLSILYI